MSLDGINIFIRINRISSRNGDFDPFRMGCVSLGLYELAGGVHLFLYTRGHNWGYVLGGRYLLPYQLSDYDFEYVAAGSYLRLLGL